ncbi:MAG: hypothetical protein KME16_14275 [Scytolyngbya sp. HA4215-MV1]|nr:hypothetical protein [Scytolyngbya sp. HA4215-MV1]
MSDANQADDIVLANERSLNTLVRAIRLSQGEFALILVRCNYAYLRAQLIQQVQTLYPLPVQVLQLPTSVKTLYTTIHSELETQQPQALMVVGLESVTEIDHVLISTNQIREEFRKNFSFPLVLWVNDEILQKLIQLAPDFRSWAAISITFEVATVDLLNNLRQSADAVFKAILAVGAGRFLDNASLSQILGGYQQIETELAVSELQHRGLELEPELAASWQFLRGRAEDTSGDKALARQYYEQSLAFWQARVNAQTPAASADIERLGCVLFYLGLWWRQYASNHRGKYRESCSKARDYYGQCVNGFRLSHQPELAARFINSWGEVLTRLDAIAELEMVAKLATELHEIYSEPIRRAYGYALLAEVALRKENWAEARHYAEWALSVNSEPFKSTINWDWDRHYYRNFYLLLLAQAKQHLGLIAEAITHLRTAQLKSNPQHDPSLYLRILATLRSLYFEQGQYLDAFRIKQEQRLIEHKYGLRAFVGAGRLQPPQQAMNLGLAPVDSDLGIAQELTASGRQPDINRLMERISRPDHKLIVIHGQSGVGKSSIIQAGLIPALHQMTIEARDVMPILMEAYPNWAKNLRRQLAAALGEARKLNFPTTLNPVMAILQQLKQNIELNLLTVLIFDQFEEFFFVYRDKEQRQPFYEFLGESLNIFYVKIIFVIREDYLHYLLECERSIKLEVINNDILGKDKRYYLGNFSTEEAKVIIQHLTERPQFYLEPALIDQLVADLAKEQGEVRPIELQVVGSQLQDDQITKLEEYIQLGENPKQELVDRFLEKVIEDCGPPNEEVARTVLFLLTDENNTRPLKTRAELATDLVETEQLEEKLDLVLKILVDSGIIFLLPEIPAERYQLVHDYLVALIRQKQEPALLAQISKLQKRDEQNRAEIEQLRKAKELLEALTREEKLKTDLEIQRIEQRRIEEELERARRQRKMVTRFACVVGFLAALAAGATLVAYEQRQRAAIAEVQATSSLALATFLSNDQLGALVTSIQVGRQLQAVEVPDRTQVAILGNLQQVVYNVQEHNRLEGHSSWVNSVSFSPDGQRLVSASADNSLILWSKVGKLLKVLKGHLNRVNSVSYSPDGQLIASGGDDKNILLWSQDGRNLKTLVGHTNSVTSVSFSPDSQTIASASDDNTIKLWSRQGELLKTLIGHTDRVKSVSFSPDGEQIVSAGWDKTIRLWNREGKLLKTLLESDRATAASFSPDGTLLASGGWDSTVKLWDRSGQLLQTLKGHTNRLQSVSFSPDGRTLVSASADNTVKLWDLERLQVEPKTLAVREVIGASFSPDGTFATVGADNLVRLWSLQGIEPNTLRGHQSPVISVRFSPDGKQIVSGGDVGTNADNFARSSGKVILWTGDGQVIRTFSVEGGVANVQFSPDGQTIAAAVNPLNAADTSGQVLRWKQDGTKLGIFPAQGEVTSLSFNPNGQTIALAENPSSTQIAANDRVPVRQFSGQISLWNLSGQKLKTFAAHDDRITSISYSPDGQLIASGSWDNTVKLWTADGKVVRTLKGHTGQVTNVRFSPDGKTIASTSYDTTIKLWNLDGKELQTLKGHTSTVTSVDFSQDGKKLISASSDGNIKLWDPTKGAVLASLKRNNSTVNSVVFSPDGTIVASANADQTIVLWNFNLEDVLLRGCQWLQDYLSNNPRISPIDHPLCNTGSGS